MSGPKTSKYTLTPEQRRIMEEQREREHRKAVASRNIQRNSKRLLEISGMFSAEKQVSAELSERGESDAGFSQNINELEALIAPIAPLAAGTDNNDLFALERTAKVISECVVKAEKIVRELSDSAVRNERKLQACLDDAIDRGFAILSVDDLLADQISASDAKSRMREQLLQIKRNGRLSAGLLTEINDAVSRLDEIQDEVFLKNYSALTVSPLIKKCKRFLSEYEEYHEEFEKLYSEYNALCELYGHASREYTCGAASVETLKIEIKRMKETAAEEDEQAYISECLDEVMEEMGYTILGRREVTKKNGQHFQNKLYTYGEGTAVNVTYSSDGKVAMELGGIDDADRLPDDSEASLLCDSMERFCDDFKEIEKRLLVKGVIPANRISLLPPAPEYAQIINTSDYEMRREAEKFQVKRQRRTAVKLKSRSEPNGKV